MKTFIIKMNKGLGRSNTHGISNKSLRLKRSNRGILMILCILIILWQGLSLIYPPIVLPGPALTLKALISIMRSDYFFSEIFATLKKLVIGLLGSIAAGSILGILMGSNERIKNLFEPLVYFIQSTPPILYMALAMIWFGLDGQATIFIVFIASIPIMAVNIKEGFQNIDTKLIEMGKTFKFSKMEMITQIVIPSLKAYFKSGLVIVIGLGWKLVVMGEVLSSSTGLGSQITDARMNVQTDMVFAWGIIVITLCFLSQKIILTILDLKILRRKSYDI